LDFNWNWGDGTANSTGIGLIAPSHTYASSGLYTVTLVVTDGAGYSSPVDTAVVTITAPPVLDWPMFRHDEANTGSTNESGPLTNNLKWSTTLLYQNTVYSPVVVDGVAYFAEASGVIYAFDINTGEELWNYTTVLNGDAYPPAVVDGVLYFGLGDGQVYALNTNGTFLWNHTIGGPTYAAPTVVSGVVYIGSNDNKLYALRMVLSCGLMLLVGKFNLNLLLLAGQSTLAVRIIMCMR